MSIIQWHLDYASTVWFYSITQALRNKLQTTKNKLVRFVLNLDSQTHDGNEQLAVLNWLPVAKRVDFITLCHVFKSHNNSSHSYIQEHFIQVSSSHQYSTRFRVTTTNNSNNSDIGFKDSGGSKGSVRSLLLSGDVCYGTSCHNT